MQRNLDRSRAEERWVSRWVRARARAATPWIHDDHAWGVSHWRSRLAANNWIRATSFEMPMGRRAIFLIDQAYTKFAGEKTAIQSSTDGLVQPYFTVTHSVSSPCQILKFEKQHVMYTVKWLCSYRIVCHIWGMIHVFSSLICQVCVDTSTYLFYNVCTKQNSSIKKIKIC